MVPKTRQAGGRGVYFSSMFFHADRSGQLSTFAVPWLSEAIIRGCCWHYACAMLCYVAAPPPRFDGGPGPHNHHDTVTIGLTRHLRFLEVL
jgi:hypothetical protein